LKTAGVTSPALTFPSGQSRKLLPYLSAKKDTTLKEEDGNISEKAAKMENKILHNYWRTFLFLVSPEGKWHRSSFKKLLLKCRSRPTFIAAHKFTSDWQLTQFTQHLAALSLQSGTYLCTHCNQYPIFSPSQVNTASQVQIMFLTYSEVDFLAFCYSSKSYLSENRRTAIFLIAVIAFNVLLWMEMCKTNTIRRHR